jgi:hypothetical protein
VYTHHAHQHRTQVLSYKAGFQDLEATALGPLHCDVIDLAEIMVACVEGRLDEVGEFMSLYGVFERLPLLGIFASSSIVFSAAYTIYMFNRIAFGGSFRTFRYKRY